MLHHDFDAPARLLGLGLLLASCGLGAQPRVAFQAAEATRVAETISLSGTVTSPRDAALSSSIAGLVEAVLVDAGDRVTAGQPLLMLDDALAKIALRREAASVREAKASLAEARRLRDEAAPLARQGSLPESEFASRKARAEGAAAMLSRSEAAQAEQAERLNRHTLRAPFAGVIRARLTDPGEWIATGTPVLELVATDNLRIDVRMPQQRFAALAADNPAQVSFAALPGQAFDAKVTARVPALDASARSFLVRLSLTDTAPMIAPGMSARVTFALPSTAQAVAIPRDALLRYPDGSSIVWVVDDNDQARRRPVTLGAASGERVLVTQGLSAGERVIVRGNETLKPGQAVLARPHRAP